ncbi:Uncharacterized protein APZ42_025785 [Daphnia magna]|uniref:Uncharacterized protein n=1 Tax=Daphnia magna TaxID=35525 RepID=A0A162EEU4_9CRUS|nr:Uncharacterized protein APZ42_025785 [Daphnia magna]
MRVPNRFDYSGKNMMRQMIDQHGSNNKCCTRSGTASGADPHSLHST